ncbi:MAG: 3-oxoacyl-ACP reductase FabG [Betaproteobacteria bacterium]|jgi:3-oxoacyl-[acyl-carrier protein] reductase|nr:MAG: 3-oxoacyl-ACP reductase FabG [Betaproteobacteria bacterium]
MGQSLAGKTALVTGSSRGIGRAIAKMLGTAGAKIAGTATTAIGAQSVTDYIRAAGIEGAGYELDVTNAEACKSVIADIEESLGPISILVNNAGITRDNLLMRMKDQEWDDIMETNLKSVFRLTKLVARPMMKARSGRIINITSVVGFMGNAGQANYAAAKAGVEGFSKSMARELGSRNVTVNCVAPGFIDTDMTRALSEAQRESLIGHVPLGRFGSCDEVAEAVLFLASDGAGYVTGSTIHVNGGMLME